MFKVLFKNKNFKNATWLICGKLMQAILAFVVSVLTARYLGPSNFGIISYASSITAFAIPIMQLGFNSTLVQEITNSPDEEGKILGTSILFSFLSAIVCVIGLLSFVLLANFNERTTILVCVLYSLMLIPKSFELITYWFQAKLKSKYVSISTFIAFSIMSAYKIFLLASGQNVYWFAISYTIEIFIIAALLIIIYACNGGQKLSCSSITFRKMISKSVFFIISDLMVAIFAQTDRIMLKHMINEAETGFYTAGLTTAGMVSFIYQAIIDSLRPTIFEYKKQGNEKKYIDLLALLYSLIIYLSLMQNVLMTIFAPYIIQILYGEAYESSIIILQVVVWYTTFSFYGGAKDVWILAENKQKYVVFVYIGGAITNVGLNLLFIPFLGSIGAAIASLITQFAANILLMIIIKPLRNNQKILLKSFNLVKCIKNVYKS